MLGGGGDYCPRRAALARLRPCGRGAGARTGRAAGSRGRDRGRPAAADTPAPGDDTPIASPSPPPEGAVLPEVAPIIPDDEFKKAIPPISAENDPELDKPLRSIADFERRVADAAKQKANGTADADILKELTVAISTSESSPAFARILKHFFLI